MPLLRRIPWLSPLSAEHPAAVERDPFNDTAEFHDRHDFCCALAGLLASPMPTVSSPYTLQQIIQLK
jgi:hypothetical protein